MVLKKKAKKKNQDRTLVLYKDVDRKKYYVPRTVKGALPPDTYYVFVDDEPIQLTTITASGTRIAWTTCGSCMLSFHICECGSFTVPRSIEYICDKDSAVQAGEEWGINHPNYKGTYRNKRHVKKSGGLTKSVQEITSVHDEGDSVIQTEYDNDRPTKTVKRIEKKSLAKKKSRGDTREAEKHERGAIRKRSAVRRR